MNVTVFRQVPPLIIGTCGVVAHQGFDRFEAQLDSLEASGVIVERLDRNQSAEAIAARPAVQRLVATEGDRAFPLVLVNNEIVMSGRYPSPTEWAHAIGVNRRAEKLAATC